MKWQYCDGGRAASGRVGTAGDCVVRAIAIATGRPYREVYKELFNAAGKTPRNGVRNAVCGKYIRDCGWTEHQCDKWGDIPTVGVVIASTDSHWFAVADGVMYDTWNISGEPNKTPAKYWTPPEGATCAEVLKRKAGIADPESQAGFDKILKRLRAMDRTAKCGAATEAERSNAIRAIQTTLLTHNLNEEFLREDVDGNRITKMAVPLNGKRRLQWEASLAWYVTNEVFGNVQHYLDDGHNRKLMWFYGPLASVQQCCDLYRELLVTIAAAAKCRYGGYTRQSGASYAEGFVKGLPSASEINTVASADALIAINNRQIAVQRESMEWLSVDCGVNLVFRPGTSRRHRDPDAEASGFNDGSKQKIAKRPKLLGIGCK